MKHRGFRISRSRSKRSPVRSPAWPEAGVVQPKPTATLHLFVCVHDAALTPRAIVDDLRTRSSRSRCRDHVHVVASLPEVGDRKTDRKQLKQQLREPRILMIAPALGQSLLAKVRLAALRVRPRGSRPPRPDAPRRPTPRRDRLLLAEGESTSRDRSGRARPRLRHRDLVPRRARRHHGDRRRRRADALRWTGEDERRDARGDGGRGAPVLLRVVDRRPTARRRGPAGGRAGPRAPSHQSGGCAAGATGDDRACRASSVSKKTR
jgi:hypothetical protein